MSAGKDHVARPGADRPSIDQAAQPRAHGFPDPFGQLEPQPAFGRRLNDGARDHMMRGLLERGAEHHYVLGGLARRNFDGKQPRAAYRQCPGLVEQYGMGARQRFQRASALDQNAAPPGQRRR